MDSNLDKHSSMQAFWIAVLDFAKSTTTEVGAQLLKDFGQMQALEKALVPQDGNTKIDYARATEISDRPQCTKISSQKTESLILSFNGYQTLKIAIF
jgi:hypothetical protein